ncbi:MAG: YhcH/YjgK/YiaL family protein [Pyrinomonadaceae bacterium]|nr:YhcH/YjgK/YiaL family protein [Sphingobacteriaceae bacterium]
MIFDKLENLNRYNERLGFISTILEENKFIKGKFDIGDTTSFGIGLEYTTRVSDKCLWEAHRKYLDIHVILEGEELVEIGDISNMEPTKEYEDDYQLFKGNKEHSLRLLPGKFLILFPNEVHKTGVKTKHCVGVKKIVFKLLLDDIW